MNAKVALTALSLFACGSVFAQDCATPVNMNPNVPDQTAPGAPAVITGDTCGSANSLGTLCGLFGSPENDLVYRFTTDADYTATTFTLTNNTPAWNAALFRLGATCGGGADCLNDADTGGAGANESFSVAGLVAGNHHLIVSSSPEAGGCGSFTLSIDGNLPVELQSFSVE